VIRRDHAFLLFLVSAGLAYLVYVAYETVLPIAAVNSHDIAPSTWGFLVIINPALVTLFQPDVHRVTRSLLVSGSVAMFVLVLPRCRWSRLRPAPRPFAVLPGDG
jgi:hypothetical protein